MNVVRRNEFGGKTLRVIGDVESPWFVAKEVAEVLGISDYRHFVASLEPHQAGVYSIHTSSGSKKVRIISESAFYEFVFQSRKPEARAFKKWVFEDLLPTLRKEGKYQLERRAEQAERLLLEADQRVMDLEARLESVREVLRDDTDQGIKIIDRVVHLQLVQQQELNTLDLHSKELGVEKNLSPHVKL
jgi:prophage antirepressor-like protein